MLTLHRRNVTEHRWIEIRFVHVVHLGLSTPRQIAETTHPLMWHALMETLLSLTVINSM